MIALVDGMGSMRRFVLTLGILCVCWESVAYGGPIPKFPTPIAVAAGGLTTCELQSSGLVNCWGHNDVGQVGVSQPADVLSKKNVAGLAGPAKAIAVGQWHSCALLVSGDVQCWGSNYSGALGSPQNFGNFVANPNPVSVVGLAGPAIAIAAGQSHTCAIVQIAADTVVECWGKNSSWQLGNDVVSQTATPMLVPQSFGARAITAGITYTCMLDEMPGGSVPIPTPAHCWGDNFDGELGQGVFSGLELPGAGVQSAGLFAIAAGSGAGSTCGTIADGSLSCWGANNAGQVVGSFGDAAAPVILPGAFKPTSFSAAENNRCIVDAGAVFCWGFNPNGQIGNGSVGGLVMSPTPTAIQAGATRVAVGGLHACAIVYSQVKCWGFNGNGSLGNGTLNDSPLPVATIF